MSPTPRDASAPAPVREPPRDPAGPILPPHIEATVRAIARLHSDHHEAATPTERAVQRLSALLSRPRAAAGVLVAALLWIALNLGIGLAGARPPDPPPFNYAQGLLALAAVLITTLILAAQRRDDELAGLREQLTLELAILSEQKSAKLIALLEEMRRDDPLIRDRRDPEAEALSEPADPTAVLEALRRVPSSGAAAELAGEAATPLEDGSAGGAPGP